MVYILEEDVPEIEDVAPAFKKYRSYIRSNKNRLPSQAYDLALSDWYYNSNDHRCPHDAWLESVTISEPSKGKRSEIRTTEIKVVLLGAYHDGHIEISYKNVHGFLINAFKVEDGHYDWKDDEFRISERGHLIHEIEWAQLYPSSHWIIEAEDFEYKWLEK